MLKTLHERGMRMKRIGSVMILLNSRFAEYPDPIPSLLLGFPILITECSKDSRLQDWMRKTAFEDRGTSSAQGKVVE